MVILESVEAKVLDDYRLFSIQGPAATGLLSEMVPLPTLDANEAELENSTVALLRTNRAGQGGWDIAVPSSARRRSQGWKRSLRRSILRPRRSARIEAGTPKMGSDITSKTMPPGLGPAFDARHVSYNKGCYTGQEVLMRIHSRGHTNKTWMGLIAEEPLEVGAAIKHSRRPDAGRSAVRRFLRPLDLSGRRPAERGRL